MKTLIVSLRCCAVTLVLCGLIYPAAVTALAHLLFAHQAGGSLIGDADGKIVGSELIGQEFSDAAYFHGRPSAGNGDPMSSGGSNSGPTSRALKERIASAARRLAGEYGTPVPIDLVTTSGSGLDPHITPLSAQLQVARVAAARGVSPELLREIVDRFTQPRDFWILGEARVAVLPLNLALDARFGAPRRRDGSAPAN
ncbi:MAG TPA: potassium-transporting ATPase subunit KdpC [Candidatus Ozemobacteraceae bacterium]